MSNLRINCPRCHASLHVNRHQEQSGHLGCTHCGQLIRLAPRMSSAPTLATPMVAPAMQTGAYWNQSPQARKQSNTALWAVAIASLGMFLTVLTLCVTFLLWQKQQVPAGNQVANDDRGGGFIPPGKEEPPAPAPIQPAINEQPLPEVAEQQPAPVQPAAPQPALPAAEDPLGRNQNNNAGFLPPAPEAQPPAPAPQRPGPFAANKPTKAPPPEPLPLPEPERPKPALGNKIIN